MKHLNKNQPQLQQVRTTLLLALPDEHQLRFNKYKTAQELRAAILKTFGGNEATKKTKKNMLKHHYGNFKAEGSETLEQTFNRLQAIVSHLEFMDIEIEQDDLNQKFLTSLAQEWLMHTIVRNEEVNTASTQVSPAGPNVATASISHDTACTYIASQSNGSQIKYEDINQIDEDDIEEMDIKAPRSQDKGRRDNYIQGSKVKEQAPKALMAIDEVGWDWSFMENKEENHAAVPHPPAQVYSPPKKEMSWTGLLEFADDTIIDYSRPSPAIESNLDDFQNRNPSVAKTGASSSTILSKPAIKFVKSVDRPTEIKTNKVETVKKPAVKYAKIKFPTGNSKFSTADLGNKGKAGNSQINIDDKGYWDSACSRHMTSNISYLLDYDPFDGGYVSFGQGGCKITGKGTIKTECILLGRNFKLTDDTNVLLRTPRQHNMYSIDLNNVVPHKDLTCLVAKASADECMLWHRRLGHLNIKTMNRNFITKIENLKDLKVKIIRCDNGGEFRNKEMNNFCSKKGIKREFNNARTPQQNGVAERRNRTLIEAARTMFADAKLPVTFWAKAVNIACYVQNRVLVNKSQNKTPYELFNGRTPAIGFLKPFGCHVMILNTLDHLGKFEAKGDEGYFIGYSMSSKAFKVFNKRIKRVEENLHVDFLENKLIEKGAGPNWLFDIDSLTSSINYVPVVVAAHLESSISNAQDACTADAPESSENFNPTATSTNPSADHMETLAVETLIPTVSSPISTDCLNDSLKLSSDTRLISKRVTSQDDTPSLDNILTLTNRFEDILGVTTNTDESNRVEADLGNMEYNISASPTPTFRIHKDHPKRVRPIGIKWVLKNKKDERGIVIKKKSRLVAQEHTQEEWIDYDEVFTPAARIEAIRLFLAYASFIGFTVYQMDVKSAFLYGTIDEEVYVMQPPGFQDLMFPARVYKVEKAMYGLHQAPRAWYGTLSKYLLTNGFQRGIIDQTLFIRRQKGDFILVQVYVDDIIFGSSNPQLCREFEALMHEKFQMSAMGKMIFIYLKGHPKLGLWYPKDSPFDLVAYSDSDYGGATQDRKSTTRGCQFLGRRLISWQCKKQIIMATSTTEADYVAAASGCGQVLHHFIRDCFEKKLISVDHIHTDDNVADLLTKPLDAGRFQYLVVEQAMRGSVKGNHIIYTIFKYEHNVDFHKIVDFVEASHLRYALTINPTVYVSHIRQFWSTARIEITDEGTKILATVDGKPRTISESSIRRNIKLKAEAGISSLPDAELFENLTLMGYNILPNQKFSLQKGQFSHQWKYLIHTIMQCLSPKSTGFNEFSSNIATALVCLATNRVYNFSKMIFDGMVRNVNNKGSKFLMYPRFLSKCLKMGQFGQITHTHTYTVPFHTRKIFTTLRVDDPSFLGRTVPLFPTMLVTMGEGSGTPTEPHHIPSPKAQQTSPTATSSPSLPPVTTATIPTVIPTDTSQLRQYTRRARIAQSLALLPVADKPVSPIRDDSQGEACPTVSGLEAEHNRANITKTSTLPSDSTPRVTSLATNEGSMQHKLTELTDLIKLLKDKDGGADAPSGEDAPIKGRSLETEEEAAKERSTKKGSDDTEEMVNVLTSLDASSVLSSGVQVSVPPAAEVTTSHLYHCYCGYTLFKKERDAKIARIHAEEELQMMIDGLDRSNEMIAKHLQKYEQAVAELTIGEKIELINELVKYQDHLASILKYKAQQSKPLSKKQQREFYMSVLRSHSGWKAKHFKAMTLEEIRENFDPVWKQIQDFIPIVVVVGTNSTNFSGTKEAAGQDVKKDVSSLRYIAFPNWFHEAHLESSTNACNTDAPESSGNSNPTATSTNPPTNHMETLAVETPISTVSSPVSTSCLNDSPKLSSGVRPIGTKWVLKNKKDERGIVIRNKARLVAQGHTQKEGIDYNEVFAPVVRIEAIRLFLAYALFIGFTVYQMDVKSAFLYVLHKKDGIFLSQDKYVGDILKKFGYSDVRSANTPMDKENPWGKDETGKDVDLHLYRSMIGSLMYLTASRPDIMFAVCACASDYGGATQDCKSTTRGCQFLGRRLISWQCKKQTIVATSTTEAEYVAAASGCGQVL
nr:hypothetical protein [Tanacetum cinerariifolium]